MKSLNKSPKTLDKETIIQFFKYAITAGIATLFDWGSFYVFYNFLGINEYLSNIMSFAVWFVINYFLSVIFVFKKSKHKKLKEVLIVLATSVSALVVNTLCLFLFIRVLNLIPFLTDNIPDLIPMISKIIASGICMVYNFVLRKIFVFD